MKQFIKKNPIWSFLIINYLISWGFLYPSYQIILENKKITSLALIGLIGAYGPTIAAIIVQYFIDKQNLKKLLIKIVQAKTGLFQILFVVIAPLAIYLVAYLVAIISFDGNFSVNWRLAIANIPVWFLAALPFGPMGEELGWRGFMLPKLMEKHSIIKSTFLVGLAWGVWHLASFTFPGAALPEFLEVSFWTILLYFANTIGLSMIYTYVYLKTNGSVFYAIILHSCFNAAANISFDFFGVPDNNSILIFSYVLNFVLAALIGLFLLKNRQPEKQNL